MCWQWCWKDLVQGVAAKQVIEHADREFRLLVFIDESPMNSTKAGDAISDFDLNCCQQGSSPTANAQQSAPVQINRPFLLHHAGNEDRTVNEAIGRKLQTSFGDPRHCRGARCEAQPIVIPKGKRVDSALWIA